MKIKIVFLVCGSSFVHISLCLSLSRFAIRVEVEASHRVPCAYKSDPHKKGNNLYFILSLDAF